VELSGRKLYYKPMLQLIQYL